MFPAAGWLSQMRVLRSWGVAEGTPIQVGERTIVPLGRTISLSMRGRSGLWGLGMASTRPIAVRVESPQSVQVVPIPDLTRRIVWLIGISSIVLSLAVRLALAWKQSRSV